ncbi:MAG: hypothetical protein Pg6C_17870 [Treponemataceae bacterium]|nr:MAG: hypothetical protein Pg6C_17870 [Treponemataceae bacterium]
MSNEIKKPPGGGGRILLVLTVVASLASIAGFILALIQFIKS